MVKRLNLYSRISSLLFVASILFYVLNDAIFESRVPLEIVGYIIFFSLGAFVGVQCCIDLLKKSKKESSVPSGKDGLN